MNKKYEVSIIVCTYNSKWEKLRRTLLMALNQKNVAFEIVISDDGSAVFNRNKVIQLLESNEFHDYTIIQNEENVGTVRNSLTALKQAAGEYSFLTSPGDMLYDDTVLADFYKYAKENRLKILFGRAAYYSYEEKLRIHKILNSPDRLWVYKNKVPSVFQKYNIFNGSKIVGATFFRETKTAIQYFEQILPFTVYVEDATSALLMAINNERITFFDRYIVWYEYGTGISTAKNEKWNQIIRNEINNVSDYIFSQYDNDRVVAYLRDKGRRKRYQILYKYPDLILMNLIIKVSRKKMTGGDSKQFEIIENMLDKEKIL